MCLPRVRDEEPAQVYPEETRRHHPSDVSARQSMDKRIHYMQNLRKEKRKLGKRFARPAPVPDPGIILFKVSNGTGQVSAVSKVSIRGYLTDADKVSNIYELQYFPC
ncbi:coiled-coil domain-containing protein 179 [Chionomys nivalis]|uniref:coiled-coil domain-containing protein 179 n=1 Tax=Chionomys nivalis TaxID=269649 RepID=UPI002596B8A6|nr:coiled-coil domain-containing protein 179 [Chionomys nivalis]